MRFEVGTATDQGMVRETNQDRSLVHGNLVAVADGMGGHAGGELAAETAVEDLRRFPLMAHTDQLVAGIVHANREVLQAAERTGMTNMGTTVVAALLRLERRSVVIGNVGDSRAYLLSRGELAQITNDHSLVEDLIQAGKISEEEARDHPHRNVVTRVLGLTEDPEVDTFELAVRDGDMLLLASDGLFNEVDHLALATILDNATDLDEAASRLVERANQNGGHDNITVVIVRIVDDGAVAAAPASASEIAAVSDSTEVGSSDHEAVAEPIRGLDENDDQGAIDPEALSVPAITDVEPGVTSDPATDEIPVVPRARAGRMRVFVFLVCLLALLGLGIGGFVAYGQNSWFVDTVANEVVIHRGRPGGVLFIEPQPVQPTGIDINDLNPSSRDRVGATPIFTSLEDAEQFVESLERSALRADDTSE